MYIKFTIYKFSGLKYIHIEQLSLPSMPIIVFFFFFLRKIARFGYILVLPIQEFVLVRILASLVAQTVKNLLAMLETQDQSLGWEDPPGEGNGNPLQYSCLENSMKRGTWRAIVHGSQRVGCDWVTYTSHWRR